MAAAFARPAVKFAVIFVAGVVVGAACMFIWLPRQLKHAEEFVSLASRAQAQEEAFKHYRSGDRQVALYVLNLALEEQEHYLRDPGVPPGHFWDLGLLHARLAKVHSEIGDKVNTDIHVAQATAAFARTGWKLRTADELWGALELIDNRKLSEAIDRYGARDR